MRDGLTTLLTRFGHTVVAAVHEATALVDAVETHRPDVAVTDVRMAPTFTDEGLQAAISLRRMYPDIAVLVLSQYIEPHSASELLNVADGSRVGYLLKDRVGDVTEFVDALHNVAAGGTAVDPQVIRRLLQRHQDPLQRLSPREREVLALMAEGRSNAAIARALVVSDAAVSKHIGNLLAKLDLPPDDDDHRRVRAVLAYLRSAQDRAPT
jgi:DNA-binding NarL/FixJ family response regulator